MPRHSVSPNQNPFNNSEGEPFDSHGNTLVTVDNLAQSCNCGANGCQASLNTKPTYNPHHEMNELKMLDFAKQYGKKKVD